MFLLNVVAPVLHRSSLRVGLGTWDAGTSSLMFPFTRYFCRPLAILNGEVFPATRPIASSGQKFSAVHIWNRIPPGVHFGTPVAFL